MAHLDRESWLTAAGVELAPLFDMAGKPLPKIRITCGFPLSFKRTGAVTEVFAPSVSLDGTTEVMVSPTLADPATVFAALANALSGYQGLPPEFIGDCESIIAGLGDYPHAAMQIKIRKAQGTRMLKASCPVCHMIVRMTSKWAATPPLCSVDGELFVIEGNEGAAE